MLNQTTTPPASSGLIRILGVGFGLAVIVGSTLGIGILRTPGLVAAQLPTASGILIVWIAGGLFTLLAAACIAELGTMLPQAGGYYVYARRAFGDAVGFVVGWTDWITYCAVLGYISIAIGEFAALLLPSLVGLEKVIALVTLAALAALQLAGLRASSRFQAVSTAVKCAAFLIVIAGALIFAPPVAASAISALPPPSLGGLVVALQSVVVTYGGWQSALYFAEEDRDPKRNLPRSMIGGVASVVVVYLLVNLALLRALPLDDLARSTLPAADAARILLGDRGRGDHHDPVDRIAAPDSQRHPDDRFTDSLRDGTRRAVLAAGCDGERAWHASGGDAGDDGDRPGADRDRDVSAAGRDRLVLPRDQLGRQLPRPYRAATPGAERSPAVPRLGLSVVRSRGAGRRDGIPGRGRDRRHDQRHRRGDSARRRPCRSAGVRLTRCGAARDACQPDARHIRSRLDARHGLRLVGQGSDAERQCGSAQPDLIAVSQAGRAREAPAVHVRTVLAAEILQDGLAVGHDDPRVMPRDAARIDLNRRVRLAADDVDALQQHDLTRVQHQRQLDAGRRRRCGRSLGDDLGHEVIAEPINGSDEHRAGRRIVQRTADLGDEAGQVRLLDKRRRPQMLLQLRFRDRPGSIDDEERQELERLRREMDFGLALEQLADVVVKPELAKAVHHEPSKSPGSGGSIPGIVAKDPGRLPTGPVGSRSRADARRLMRSPLERIPLSCRGTASEAPQL